jgi:hypothetical protein
MISCAEANSRNIGGRSRLQAHSRHVFIPLPRRYTRSNSFTLEFVSTVSIHLSTAFVDSRKAASRPSSWHRAMCLLHQAMHSVLHRRTAMVIEMACGGGAFVCHLSWKCRRHVATCRHDMTCRSNFGQMGPCCRHKIEDVVAVCVGLSRHLPDFPKCVCRNILWYGSTYTQILSHPHALSAHFCHVLPGRFVMFSKFVMFSNRLCN